jgi:hypothetical protein
MSGFGSGAPSPIGPPPEMPQPMPPMATSGKHSGDHHPSTSEDLSVQEFLRGKEFPSSTSMKDASPTRVLNAGPHNSLLSALERRMAEDQTPASPKKVNSAKRMSRKSIPPKLQEPPKKFVSSLSIPQIASPVFVDGIESKSSSTDIQGDDSLTQESEGPSSPQTKPSASNFMAGTTSSSQKQTETQRSSTATKNVLSMKHIRGMFRKTSKTEEQINKATKSSKKNQHIGGLQINVAHDKPTQIASVGRFSAISPQTAIPSPTTDLRQKLSRSSVTPQASRASSAIPGNSQAEIEANALAFQLLANVSSERDSPRKERLLELAKVLVSAITSTCDAEKAKMEAEVASKKAEFAYMQSKESLLKISGLVKEFSENKNGNLI